MTDERVFATDGQQIWDCLVIGGGPAGLTAAIYLARFHLAVVVLDSGDSRLASVPISRNHAGFPDGIAGSALLGRMRAQAERYGVVIQPAAATGLRQRDALFACASAVGMLHAQSVLLATGVHNHRPPMPNQLHDEALRRGLVRYCPICDGYEVTDRPVAVIGSGERGTAEAEFLRSYTADICLIPPQAQHELTGAQRLRLAQGGIRVIEEPVRAFRLVESAIELAFADGWARFATLYPALGSVVRSGLARQLDAAVSAEGCLMVDAHQRSSVAGLYAAGDVVLGLDQISHAMGQGGVAATTIRNDLAAAHPLRR